MNPKSKAHGEPAPQRLSLDSDSQSKPLRWVGSSKEDLSDFPQDVRRRVGGALWEAQCGRKAPYAKPLRGFGGAGVLEVIDDYEGDTYRAVYTLRFAAVVYVLHAFQKKSKSGIKTPLQEIEKVESRLKEAEKDYAEWIQQHKQEDQDHH